MRLEQSLSLVLIFVGSWKMGLFRYLRRKLNTQRLKEIGELILSKTDRVIQEQVQLKEKEEQTIAGLHKLEEQADLTELVQQLKETDDCIAANADQELKELKHLKKTGDDLMSSASVTVAEQKAVGQKTSQILTCLHKQREITDCVAGKTEKILNSQQEILNKTDQALAGQQLLNEASGVISSKVDQTIKSQQELVKKVDQAISVQQQLKEKADSTAGKAEKILNGQQEIQNKTDEALAGQQQLNEASGVISSKVDQTIKSQQELVKKVDQAISVQQQLNEASGLISSKADKVIKSQQQLVKKADLAIIAGQQLKEIADSTAVKAEKILNGQREIINKSDQVLAGQQGLKQTGDDTKSRLEQINTTQKQCVNELEFTRMSRTLFAGFNYWENNFYNAIKGTDIEERYDRLVRGLTDIERTKVDTILGRIQCLCEKGDKTCYLPDESERIYRNRKENQRIVKLNDHCFVYRNFKLPINVFEMSTFVCNYGLNLIDHPEYADGWDIIDAGAYIGDSALVFDKFFSKCRRIYAFEPDPKSYALMEKTIAMNKLRNVIPVRLALGDANSEGELTSHDMGANLVNRQFGKETEKDRTVQIVRLDDYVKENNLEPRVIKTDLEGYEMHFLRGALETIKKNRPILVLSIYHSADDFFGIKPFIESLDLAYRFKFFKADDGMILGGACLMCIPE